MMAVLASLAAVSLLYPFVGFERDRFMRHDDGIFHDCVVRPGLEHVAGSVGVEGELCLVGLIKDCYVADTSERPDAEWPMSTFHSVEVSRGAVAGNGNCKLPARSQRPPGLAFMQRSKGCGFYRKSNVNNFGCPEEDDSLRRTLPFIAEGNSHGYGLGVVVYLGCDRVDVSARVSASHLSRDIYTVGGMLGGSPRVVSSGTSGKKSQETQNPANPELRPRSSRTFGSRISSLPLGAKIGFAVIMTFLAASIGVFGIGRYMEGKIGHRAIVLRILGAIGILCIGLAVATA